MDANNRRLNSRVPFRATVSMRFPEQSYERCETADLSLKGVSVAGVTGHRIGEQCDVELYLTGSTTNLHLTMKGEVVRVKKEGLALRFFAMDLESFFHLKNIIAYNLGNPDQVEQEFNRQLGGETSVVRSID